VSNLLSHTNTQALAALSVSDKRRPAQRRSDFADAQRAGLTPVVQALSITPARACGATCILPVAGRNGVGLEVH